MIATFIEWASRLPMPTIWAGVSLVLGALITLFVVWSVNRKFGPLQKTALTGLVEAQKAQVALTRESLVMQKDHYELELSEMKKERDNYRAALHSEKEAHQAVLLTVADLQARPNVDKVYDGQQTFFQKNTETMQAILNLIREHDSTIEERTLKIIEPVQLMCAEVVRALNGHKLRKVTQKQG